MEVYVRPVNHPTKLRVSMNGGFNPVWRSDGKELFYEARGVNIMAVDIQLGETPKVSQSKILFRACSAEGVSQGFPEYDVTGDGKRFIFSCFGQGTNRRSWTVAIGWMQTMKGPGARQ